VNDALGNGRNQTMNTHRQAPQRRLKGTACVALAALLPWVPAAFAASPSALDTLLQSARPALPGPVKADSPVPEPARMSLTPDGHLRFLGAPPGYGFPVSGAVPGKPEQTARVFLRQNAALLGAQNAAIDFQLRRSKTAGDRRFARFQQTYAGIPVFAAEVTVQLNPFDTVDCVLSDIMRDTQPLDAGQVPTKPILSAGDAAVAALGVAAAKARGAKLTVTDPQLAIFDPAVLDAPGSQHLVWDMWVSSEDDPTAGGQILLDAVTGALVRHYPAVLDALNRQIYDSNNTTADPGTLTRSEGGAASTIGDVNDAYEFLEDTYNFYSTNHGRDSMDGSGLTLSTTVRYCYPGYACPYDNSFFSPSNHRLYFGDGWAVDDIVGHEYTHAVTHFESDLKYENASGAINESFSDIWGEFVDLGNGAGTDTQAVRWLIGEDLAATLRDMENPPTFSDPDRMGSPSYVQPVANPNDTNDYGGVHTNCGVNNKLCFLLTDGDTFNGRTVTGMGVATVAGLYYYVNVNILTSGANHTDLYHSLRQAAINLGWTVTQRNNLYRACQAVEIADAGRDVYVDSAFSGTELGTFANPFNTVWEGYTAASPGDRLFIRVGSYPQTILLEKAMEVLSYDGSAVIGQ
jgi:bacillolysin